MARRDTTGGNKVAGRKRHVRVGTLGLIRGLAALPANVRGWDGAEEVVRRCGGRLPRLARVWAGAGYRALLGWVAEHCRRAPEIVLKRPGPTTFVVHKRRWVAARTFGWLGRYRRRSKDAEANPKSREARTYVAMIHRMSRLTLPQKSRDDDRLRRPPKRRSP